jgi:amino acid transporter
MTAGVDVAPPTSAIGVAAPRLRQGALGQLGSLGQSIANIAPTLTPALNMTVVAKLAGLGSWLAYLVAMIGMMFVAANIGALARRHPQSGSFFIYIGRTFGPLAGALSGWSMICAYLFTAVSVTLAFTLFVGNVLGAVGLGGLTPPPWVVAPAFVALVWLAGYRDIQLSSTLALVLEGISIGVIVAIIAMVTARHHTIIDPAQLDLRRLPLGGVMSGLAFAVFSFVGFESAATLSKETHDPHVAVPRAIMFSAAAVGLFFVVVTYLMVLGMGGDVAALAASGAPFADLTARAGLGWAAAIVYASALISSFACALACISAASRLLFSMGRYEVLHQGLGAVHPRHSTPHVAVTLCCAVTLAAVLAVMPVGVLDAFGLTGTFATMGFLLVYLLVCLAAPLDARRAGDLTLGQAVVAAVGVLLVGFVIFGSIYPVPPAPYDLIPYLFALYMALGGAWFVLLKRRRPGRLAIMEHDLEQ